MKWTILLVLLVTSIASAQLPKAPPAIRDLPRMAPTPHVVQSDFLPGEPRRLPFPSSCNPAVLAALVIEYFDAAPSVIEPAPCEEVYSVCASVARISELEAMLVDEQASLARQSKILALARRCKADQ